MQKTITLDGVDYVRADSVYAQAEKVDGLEYCMVRTYSAGVFAGYVKERKGKEVTLISARRMYHWEGAASLSQLATEGTSKPDECKFPIAVIRVELTEVIEVILMTEAAKKSIDSVAVWSA